MGKNGEGPFLSLAATRTLLALGLIAVLTDPAGATVVLLTDDASLPGPARDGAPPGSMPSLRVGGGARSIALVKFDLASLPEGLAGSDVVKATLKLWVSDVARPGFLDVARVESAWSEGALARAEPPRLGVLELNGVEVGAGRRRTFLVLDVTRAVRDWIDGAAANEGLALLPGAEGASITFDSKENAQGGHEPELDVTLEWRSAPPENQGLVGPQGPEGPAGPTGLQGPVGPPGTSLNPLRLAARRWYRALQTGIAAATGSNPSAVLHDGANLWVANHGAGTITRHRLTDGGLLSTVIVGSGPEAMAFDGVSLWVANEDDGTVTKVRASDGVVQGTFAVGSEPVAVAFDGSSVWVVCSDSDSVTRLRASDGAPLGSHAVGGEPAGIAFDGTYVWVTSSLDGTVTRLLASDGSAAGTFPAGSSPGGVAFDGASIWIASRDSDSVLKIGAADGTLLGVYPAGDEPVALAFDGESLWVVNRGSGTVSQLETGDGAPAGTWTVGSQPKAIAFDGVNLWVANSADGTLSKL